MEQMQATYVDLVIHGPVLGNSDERRLVVRSGVDGRKTVGSGGETRGNIGSEDAVLRGVVETLEEREDLRVRRGRISERVDRFHYDVRVALDVAGAADLLGCSEEVLVRVDEEARVEVVDRHLDGEVLVRGDGRAVLGEDELGRRHVRRRGDDAHRRGVAGASGDLLAVRDRQVGNGRAEVDEVVLRRQRGNLAGGGVGLTVLLEARRDDRIEER